MGRLFVDTSDGLSEGGGARSRVCRARVHSWGLDGPQQIQPCDMDRYCLYRGLPFLIVITGSPFPGGNATMGRLKRLSPQGSRQRRAWWPRRRASRRRHRRVPAPPRSHPPPARPRHCCAPATATPRHRHPPATATPPPPPPPRHPGRARPCCRIRHCRARPCPGTGDGWQLWGIFRGCHRHRVRGVCPHLTRALLDVDAGPGAGPRRRRRDDCRPPSSPGARLVRDSGG